MPSYPLARGIMYFTLDRPAAQVYQSITLEPINNTLSEVWPYILALFCHGIIGMIILVVKEVIEYWQPRLVDSTKSSSFILLFYRFRKNSNFSVNDSTLEDDDVTQERRRVQNGELNDCPLLLDNLTKVYESRDIRCGRSHRKTRVAVNQLSLGLQKAEVLV